MRRTYCDRCGGECLGRVGRLMLAVSHYAKGAVEVGEDEYRPRDLCGTCLDVLVDMFHLEAEPRMPRDQPEVDEVRAWPEIGAVDQR